MQETRKKDHIELTSKSQSNAVNVDSRFYYEPLFSSHPNSEIKHTFLNKTLNAPFWISSMTGGVGEARHINQNLAKVASKYKLAMALGSCRPLLDSDEYFEDFNLRPILGDDLPFFANLGIAQLEELFSKSQENKILNILSKLKVDGLIIHVNPLQEWFQPEGDRFTNAPIETIIKTFKFLKSNNYKVIVKEVGQGMGPRSLEALLELGVDAIELASFGGTNFSKLESLRDSQTDIKQVSSLFNVGHTALEMVEMLNELFEKNSNYKKTEIIISGGIKDFLDAYYLLKMSKFNSVVGMAKNFLNKSEKYDDLDLYTKSQIEGLKVANSYLVPKLPGEK